MLGLEDCCKKICSRPGWIAKVLMGVLISWLPFAYGYLFRYADSIRRSHDALLPDWENWPKLLINGLHFLAILFFFTVIPLLAAYGLFVLLQESLDTTGLKSLASLIFAPFLLLTPPLTMSALYEYQIKVNFSCLLELRKVSGRVFSTWRQWFVPILAFNGLLLISAPLYPFALFVGYLALIPLFITLFDEDEEETAEEIDTSEGLKENKPVIADSDSNASNDIVELDTD